MNRLDLYKLVRKLRQEGFKQVKIAEILSITQARVSQILSRTSEEIAQWGGHQKAKLSANQQAELVGYLEKGATHYGFEGSFWTGKRVKWLIKEKFGLDYHHGYIPRVLRNMRYSLQKPQVIDRRRDEEQVKVFRETTLPALKKKQYKKIGK